MIGIDTETTGLDFHHGCKPFLITTCTSEGDQVFWEWRVDPLTRKPIIPKGDINEFKDLILDAKKRKQKLVFHHAKFDIRALETIKALDKIDLSELWEMIIDTQLGGHLLNSLLPKSLTYMAQRYLHIDIKHYEESMKEIVKHARRIARSKYKKWKIAKEGMKCLPSAKGEVWKNDLWLPKAIAEEEGYPKNHYWHRVTNEYANIDSYSTVELGKLVIELIKERNLQSIWEQRSKILPVVYKMESIGVGIDDKRINELENSFREQSKDLETKCQTIAEQYDYELEFPKSGNNKSITNFIFDKLKLPVVKRSKKTDNPSLDKDVLEEYEATLPHNRVEGYFIKSLRKKRARDTALGYIESYKKFRVPMRKGNLTYYKVFCSLNPTGTKTLRFSSQNPNSQQISKKEEVNLRYMFGPTPGREWFSCDAKNIELRLSAYEAGEKEMIQLFEKPNEPPYFGSYHLLVFDTLHPKFFNKYGTKCKDVYASTWYQWTKNGNFAVQYGAVEKSGTADRAYHVKGAQRIIADRFTDVAQLNQKQIAIANKYGYVETIPDKTVDPKRGYPLVCPKTNWGGVLETVPLNYHIQGTAMWWMMKAMIRCQEWLDEFNSTRPVSQHAYMVMQVHDELVFDFPKPKKKNGNLKYLKELQNIMSQGGDDIGIPTPVSLEYHPQTWNKTVAI